MSLVPSKVLARCDCSGFIQVISEQVYVGIFQRNLEDIPCNPVSKFIPIAKHHRKLEQLIVVKYINNSIDKLNFYIIKADKELVNILLALIILDKPFLSQLADTLIYLLAK